MSDFTDYSESNIVSWIVGGQDMPTAASNIYVGLHTSDPTDTGENNEVSTASYSRVSTTAGTDWNITNNTFDNAIDIIFPEAQEDWGTITHFSLWNGSPNDGTNNALAYSVLDSSRDILTGDSAVFRDGSLSGSVN